MGKVSTKLKAPVKPTDKGDIGQLAAATDTKQNNRQIPDRLGWVMAVQLLDTSWRVALPILLFCLIGFKLDQHFDSASLYTLIGLFVSLAVAVILVYQQIKNLYPDFLKGSKK